MYIARQRLCKNIPAETNTQPAIEQLPLLRNGAVNAAFQQMERLCFLRGLCKVVNKNISVEKN
jgi:hypothetical protein